MPFRKSAYSNFVPYWDTFYQGQHVREPSSFAECAQRQFLEPGRSLLELGCGNGRDAAFLRSAGLEVTGVDLSAQAIAACAREITGARFLVGDFTNLCLNERFHYIYSRFTLHSVDEPSECRTLAGAWEHLETDGLLLIEVRTVLDELCGQGERISNKEWIHDGHYRRFIIPENILKRTRKAGFTPQFMQLSKGLAKWGDQDPTVLRLVLRKDA
jgi:SAM-dependent methyltransferase